MYTVIREPGLPSSMFCVQRSDNSIVYWNMNFDEASALAYFLNTETL